jgi:hypothetical protein
MECQHNKRKEVEGFKAGFLWECQACGFVFSNKRDEHLDVAGYRNEIPSRFNPWIEHVIKAFRFFRAIKVFTINPKAKSILDVGSGRGFMLYFLRKYFGYRRAAGTQLSEPVSSGSS